MLKWLTEAVCVQLGVPLYRVARCPLFRGCLNLKGMEGQSGILELFIITVGVHSRGVFDKWGSSLVFRFLPSIMYENRVHYVTKKLEKNEAKGDYVR